jgi:hypothetical protein
MGTGHGSPWDMHKGSLGPYGNTRWGRSRFFYFKTIIRLDFASPDSVVSR